MAQMDDRTRRETIASLPSTDALRVLAHDPKYDGLLKAAAELPDAKLQATALDYFVGVGGTGAIAAMGQYGASAKPLIPFLKEELAGTSKADSRESRYKEALLYSTIAQIDPKAFEDVVRGLPPAEIKAVVAAVMLHTRSGRGDEPVMRALMRSDIPLVHETASHWFHANASFREFFSQVSVGDGIQNAKTNLSRWFYELASGEGFRALVVEPITRAGLAVGILCCDSDKTAARLQELLNVLTSKPGASGLGGNQPA